MNIFGVGLPEMVVIFVLALLIFGPKKLPEIGRSLGKTLRGFQEASKEFESEIKKGVAELEKDPPPPVVSQAPAALTSSEQPVIKADTKVESTEVTQPQTSATSEISEAKSENGVVPETIVDSMQSPESKP
jgi:sec-independent protein translocase protein TatA